MEVMLATSILLGCTVVLVELSNHGRRNSMAALGQATAQSICLLYLNEMLSGIRRVERQEPVVSEEYPGWTVGIEIEPLDLQGMSVITVTVEQEENKLGRLQSFSLSRWMKDRSYDNAGSIGSSSFSDLESELNSSDDPAFLGTESLSSGSERRSP